PSSSNPLAPSQIHADALLPSSIFSDHSEVTFCSFSSACFSGVHCWILFFILMRALAARRPSLRKSLRSFPHSSFGFFLPFPFLGRRVGFFSPADCAELLAGFASGLSPSAGCPPLGNRVCISSSQISRQDRRCVCSRTLRVTFRSRAMLSRAERSCRVMRSSP